MAPTVAPEGAEARAAWRDSDEAKEMERARLAVYEYFIDEWAPSMAYPEGWCTVMTVESQAREGGQTGR